MIARRGLLFGGALGGFAALYPFLIEPRWLDTTFTLIRMPGPAGKRIRILQLTDLHASWAVPLPFIQSAIALGLAENPDLVCLTGDFITHRQDFDHNGFVAALRSLTSARPTYAVLGNHDSGVYGTRRTGYLGPRMMMQLLDDAGVRLLHNRAERVEIRGQALNLVGVGDLWSEDLDPPRAFQSADPSLPTVLLSHNPDSKELLGNHPWHVMLCGHTHGGQVIIPFEGPRYAPVRDKRFVAGLRGWNGKQIYVSRGVGSLASVRFQCRPEVTIIDLQFGA
jgi:hypothetical protein